MKNPDFNNLLRVLEHKRTEEPVLFEFEMNWPLYEKLAGDHAIAKDDKYCQHRTRIRAFANAGYDYVRWPTLNFNYPLPARKQNATLSLNEGISIKDQESYKAYSWPDPEAVDYTSLEVLKPELNEGMKIIVNAPNSVLGGTINLAGYENLCVMLFDDPGLAEKMFNEVGSRLLRFFEIVIKHETVGAIVCNDDWGFKTQTRLSPFHLRKYVFPWYKKIVAAAHHEGKPVILHSCGNLADVMDDIINDMKFDGKHSFEDTIMPVEEAWEKYGQSIAILGGIDMDFLCRETPEKIIKRCKAMLERTKEKGGYALGSGNSIPEYIPEANYFAMINSIK